MSLTDDLTARLEWSKVDDEIAGDVIVEDGTLIIPYVSTAHQGTYRCTTTTVTGSSYMQFILTVEGLSLSFSLSHLDPVAPSILNVSCG